MLVLAACPGFAQKKKAPATTTIHFVVVDGNGSVLPKAEVSVGEGKYHFLSDAEGKVSLDCALSEMVTVSLQGYRTASVLASVLVDSESVVLTKDILYAGDEDNINLPYKSVKRRYTVGSTVTIQGEELTKYSTSDIRNVLTGALPGVDVVENFGQVGVNPLDNSNQYGAANAISVQSRGRAVMYLVDDVPVNITEVPLDVEQIESVTIIRDGLEKTMYGPTGADGIISIKTKNGRFNDRYLSVSTEHGVNVVDRMPEFVSGEQYARLNNLARYNSGLAPLYSQEDIDAYALGNPYDLTHPSIDFRSMMLKNVMSTSRTSVSSGGGNDIVRYYAYLGHNSQDDIYKIGPEAGYNNVSINGNLDVKLNRYITAGFGVLSSIGVRKSSNYGYSPNYSSGDASSNTTLGVTELPDILSDINTIPAIAFPIYAKNEDGMEFPYYGVSTKFTQNPIANILENGSYQETIRDALFKLNLNIDLSFLTKGLSSSSYASYGSANVVRIGTAEDYAAYILEDSFDFEGNPVKEPVQSGSHSVKQMTSKTKLLDFYSNRFYFVQNFAWERSFGEHAFNANADYMITKRSQKFITEHRREMNFGFNAGYAYSGKYIAQFSLNRHGTYSLLDCWSTSPALGLAWIASEEDFLKGSDVIDFLKFRVQGSCLSYDSLTSANRDTDNYSWNNSGGKFGPHSNNQWFGNSQSDNVHRTYASMLGNPNLGLEKRIEISGGIDLTAFSQRLSASLTAYNYIQDGIITQMTNVLPLVPGTSTGSLYMNYNQTRRYGLEFDFGWRDKIGDLSYSVKAWAATQGSRIIRTDELAYDEPYRSKVGKSASAIWGLKYLGKFASDEETLAVPQLFDEALQAGDLKYQDMNGDGYIDDTDACVIGDWAPKLIGALTLNLEWKGLDLAVVGNWRAFYDAQLTNSYFWNGWGDNNYSMYTLKSTVDPNAPRLTYNKVTNNFKLSGYWLTDGSFFKIQSVELGYSLPVRKLHVEKVLRGMRIYARANNLLTISGIKDVDPEALSSGLTNYPLMKTFVGGIKLTF